jgi:hypothetical protein
MSNKEDAINSTLCAALQTGITGAEKQISQFSITSSIVVPAVSKYWLEQVVHALHHHPSTLAASGLPIAATFRNPLP